HRDGAQAPDDALPRVLHVVIVVAVDERHELEQRVVTDLDVLLHGLDERFPLLSFLQLVLDELDHLFEAGALERYGTAERAHDHQRETQTDDHPCAPSFVLPWPPPWPGSLVRCRRPLGRHPAALAAATQPPPRPRPSSRPRAAARSRLRSTRGPRRARRRC